MRAVCLGHRGAVEHCAACEGAFPAEHVARRGVYASVGPCGEKCLFAVVILLPVAVDGFISVCHVRSHGVGFVIEGRRHAGGFENVFLLGLYEFHAALLLNDLRKNKERRVEIVVGRARRKFQTVDSREIFYRGGICGLDAALEVGTVAAVGHSRCVRCQMAQRHFMPEGLRPWLEVAHGTVDVDARLHYPCHGELLRHRGDVEPRGRVHPFARGHIGHAEISLIYYAVATGYYYGTSRLVGARIAFGKVCVELVGKRRFIPGGASGEHKCQGGICKKVPHGYDI